MWLAAQPAPVGRVRAMAPVEWSASLCEHVRKIGDCTAQLVGFQFKECVDQARAMGRKRHLGEDGCLDLLGVLCTGRQFIEKILDVDI
jgi:hypothetical protein